MVTNLFIKELDEIESMADDLAQKCRRLKKLFQIEFVPVRVMHKPKLTDEQVEQESLKEFIERMNLLATANIAA